MRITVTIDPDVARLLEEEANREGKPVQEVVNDAIRRGLAPRAVDNPPPPYRVRPHKTTLRPGIDAGAFNELADNLEDELVIARTRMSR